MRDIRAALLSLTAVAAVTFVYARWLHVTNATIVALTFLFIVLITAAMSRLRVAVVTSIAIPAAVRRASGESAAS